MKVNISRLPDALRECTSEVAEQLDFVLDGNGYELHAEEGETLSVKFDGKVISVVYPALNQYFRGLKLAKQHFDKKGFEVSESFVLDELGIMLDCSRNAVRSVEHLKEIIRNLALMGYNQLQLYTEETYEIEEEPYFGYMRGRYTAQELKYLDDYAARFGIELVPCIQTLAHLNQIFRWAPYGQIHDVSDIMLVDEEKTYELIDRMFAAMSKNIRSRKIHIGMDEAHLLGRGVYEDKHGAVKNRSELMVKHLKRVCELADKYGYKPMMWSDMFFRLVNDGGYYMKADKQIPQEVKELVPENLSLVYWDYYNLDREMYDAMLDHHLSFNRGVVFGGGAWMWHGFAPCNKFAIESTKIALDACADKGVKKVLMTMWGDNGAECSDLAVLPTLSFTAECAYGHNDEETQKTAFLALTDIELDKFMAIEAVNVIDKYAKPNCNNPSKYMLYNDCIGGLFDYHVKEGDGAVYEEYVKTLKSVEKSAGKYAYIFATQRALAEVLLLKYELGVMTRNAYKTRDPKAVKALLSSHYYPLVKKLENFYDAFEEQWAKENKPFGFEVQDYRLGGLIKRVEHCIARLEKFAAGKLDKIPELDEVMLDPWGEGKDTPKAVKVFNHFGGNIGANVL